MAALPLIAQNQIRSIGIRVPSVAWVSDKPGVHLVPGFGAFEVL